MKVLIALGIAAVAMLAMVFLAVILFVAAVAVDIASEFMGNENKQEETT